MQLPNRMKFVSGGQEHNPLQGILYLQPVSSDSVNRLSKMKDDEIDALEMRLLPQHSSVNDDSSNSCQIVKDDNRTRTGYYFLLFSAVCSFLGNSLEPITTFSWLMVPSLLIGLNLTALQNAYFSYTDTSKVLGFVVVTQGLAFAFGFLTMFTFEEVTVAGFLLTFLVGCFLWFLIANISLLAHIKFIQKYESTTWAMFIFPITYTAVYHTLIGRIFSTFPAIGNAVLDYAPVRQIASFAGVAGITFTVALVGSAVATSYLLLTEPENSYLIPQNERKKCVNGVSWVFASFVAMTAAMGYSLQADTLYQTDVSQLIVPQLNVSCLFGFGFDQKENPSEWDRLWGHTIERLQQHDNIIMWSEEGILVTSDKQEQEVLQLAQNLVVQYGYKRSFLGITYQKKFPRQVNSTNMFALITPMGEIAWNYQKSHPVPFVEFGVERGPPILPYYDTDLLIPGRNVRLGGAICFDMDYPTFLKQSGERQVDLLLQPSWDWKALSVRHFEGDALRSVENGMNFFRCCSDGESGVSTARGQIVGRQFTGHNPDATVKFSLPMHDRVTTMYSRVGFVFEWCIAAFTLVIWGYVLLI